MPKAQSVTLPVLRKELNRSGDSLKQELKKEIEASGESVKQELRQEIKTDIKASEEEIIRHLDTVYEKFESNQAIMAESIVSLNDKVSGVQIDVEIIKDKLDSVSGRVFFLEQKINPAV